MEADTHTTAPPNTHHAYSISHQWIFIYVRVAKSGDFGAYKINLVIQGGGGGG